jgi:hypothetical protein
MEERGARRAGGPHRGPHPGPDKGSPPARLWSGPAAHVQLNANHGCDEARTGTGRDGHALEGTDRDRLGLE